MKAVLFESIIAKHVTDENPAVTFVVRGEGATTVPKPAIDGDQAVIPYNTRVTLPRSYFDVVVGAGYDATLIETEADGKAEPAAEEAPDETLGGGSDASAGGSGAEPSGGPTPAGDSDAPAPAFDAEKAIAGNVGAVVARLADLSDEDLAKVKAAETDREQPRVGVTKAIEALIAERADKAGAQPGEGA